MSDFAVKWDEVGKRLYEIGVDRGMFYPLADNGTYNNGEAWSGLSNVTNKPEGADVNDIWADNMKYLSIRAAEKFGATIECYSYPDGFKACNGEEEVVAGVTVSGQTRKAFGFSYRSRIGNDIKFQDYGYKIHLIYNATASPVEKSYSTINDSTDVDAMSYDVETTGIQVGKVNNVEYKPTSHIEIDSTKVDVDQLAAFEQTLYGTAATYTQVADTSGTPDSSTQYYTKSGDDYIKCDKPLNAFAAGTTYYTQSAAAVAPVMPLPSDVFTAFTQG